MYSNCIKNLLKYYVLKYSNTFWCDVIPKANYLKLDEISSKAQGKLLLTKYTSHWHYFVKNTRTMGLLGFIRLRDKHRQKRSQTDPRYTVIKMVKLYNNGNNYVSLIIVLSHTNV